MRTISGRRPVIYPFYGSTRHLTSSDERRPVPVVTVV